MSLTKQELIRKLPKFIMLGHGEYEQNPGYIIVPEKTVFVFLSKASRYLPQSIVDNKFYKFFGKSERNYSVRHTDDMPDVVKGWYTHVYGPGERMSNIGLHFLDPDWPGMGVHKLPIRQNQFKTKPGKFNGESGHLVDLIPHLKPGVYFLVTCRAFPEQNYIYTDIHTNFWFPKGTPQRRIQEEDNVSKSILRRKRTTTVNNLVRKMENLSLKQKQRRSVKVIRTPIENITHRMSRLSLSKLGPGPKIIRVPVSNIENITRRMSRLTLSKDKTSPFRIKVPRVRITKKRKIPL
jgi:hypothetical protein